MALDCGKNKLLADLEAKKKALSDKLSELPTLGKDALNDIKAAAQEQLAAMNLSIPTLPEIPNFQDEIDKLVAKAKAGAPELLADLQKIENQWGDLVDNIGDVLDVVKNPARLLNFDICKDVPKVEAKVGADGKLESTPTTIDVVENIDGNPEQEDPEPIQPTAIDLPKDIEIDAIKSPSEFTTAQARAAKLAIVKAEAAFMKNLRIKMEDASTSVIGSRTKSEVNALWRNIPSAWKKRNPEGQILDYYLLNPDVKVPPVLDRWILYKSKATAYANMENAISKYAIRVINTLGKRPTIDGNQRWVNGKFDEKYKEELQATIYYDLGFGVRETNPEYGFGLRKYCGLYEAELLIPSAFKFESKNYRANFVPHFYNVTSIRNGTHVEADNDYSNMIKDYITALFDAKVTFNKQIRFAFLVMLSWTTNTAEEELEDFPKDADFIPNLLGGNLEAYENILLGTITGSEAEEISTHSEKGFIPHFMYKITDDGKKYITQYANSFEEHKELSNLGYVHRKPQ